MEKDFKFTIGCDEQIEKILEILSKEELKKEDFKKSLGIDNKIKN